MKTNSVFILLALILFSFSRGVAQQSDTATAEQNIVKQFGTLDVSYYGTTQNCIPYNVYAMKYKRSWLMAVVESEHVSFFVTKPPRKEGNLHQASFFLLDGVSRTIPLTGYHKKKNRRKIVNDLEIFGFYKFRKNGKKVVKGLLLLEIPDVSTPSEFFLFKLFQKDMEKQKEKAKKEVPLRKGLEKNIPIEK